MEESTVTVPEGWESVGTSVSSEEKGTEEKPAMPKSERGRGRPKFDADTRNRVLAAIKEKGLTHGLKELESNGLKVSMSLALAVAKENGLTFPRGRPAKAA